MALRSPALYMGNPAVNHTAQNDRLFNGALFGAESGQTASNRPLTAASGALYGPPGTMGEVTLLSNTQFTVNPARWMLQSSDSPLGGIYAVTNDQVETLAVTAQNASQYRRSYFGVWVIDSNVAGSGDDLPHWGLIDGPLVASNPQLPASATLPENFLALGEFLIPPVGQSVTYTPYNPRTTTRGGILPVLVDGSTLTGHDGAPGTWVGASRDHPVLGRQRWNGTAWGPSNPTPGIRVAKAGTQALAAQTWGAITWDVLGTVPVQSVGMQVAATPTRLIAPILGRYRAVMGSSGADHWQMRMNAGGVIANGTSLAALSGISQTNSGIVTADEVTMNPGDYVELFVYNAVASNPGTTSGGYVAAASLSYIGPANAPQMT